MLKCICGSTYCWMLWGDDVAVREQFLKWRKRRDDLKTETKDEEQS